MKYCNTLPDIPFDLKFITYPFENDRFIQYNPTSLERNYRYEVLSEHDLGVTIDLINRDLYQQSDLNAQLDPADEKLLEDDAHTPQDSMRSKYHAKSVSWLRKSEYISTEQTRFQPQTMEKVEAKVGFNVKKSFVEETLYMDRETQIVAIQKTFDETKVALSQHYRFELTSLLAIIFLRLCLFFTQTANRMLRPSKRIYCFLISRIGSILALRLSSIVIQPKLARTFRHSSKKCHRL